MVPRVRKLVRPLRRDRRGQIGDDRRAQRLPIARSAVVTVPKLDDPHHGTVIFDVRHYSGDILAMGRAKR